MRCAVSRQASVKPLTYLSDKSTKHVLYHHSLTATSQKYGHPGERTGCSPKAHTPEYASRNLGNWKNTACTVASAAKKRTLESRPRPQCTRRTPVRSITSTASICARRNVMNFKLFGVILQRRCVASPKTAHIASVFSTCSLVCHQCKETKALYQIQKQVDGTWLG